MYQKKKFVLKCRGWACPCPTTSNNNKQFSTCCLRIIAYAFGQGQAQPLQNTSYIILIIFFFLHICAPIYAQTPALQDTSKELIFIKKIRIKEPVQVSADRYGNIFIADKNGAITKYKNNGDSITAYSPAIRANITLLEAWAMLETAVFYQENQELVIFDRFLTLKQSIKIDDTMAGFARLATLAADGNIWIFDEVDFSLKKYNTRTKTIILHTPCDLLFQKKEYNLLFIKELNNLVYLVDKNNGVFLFDNFGNYKKSIYIADANAVFIANDYIYALQKDNKISVNYVYNNINNIITQYNTPIAQNYELVAVSDNNLLLFTKNEMYIFKMK